jgi:hypothetical protein
VDQGREITFRQQDAYVRRLAQPPPRGAGREAVVLGFLVAAGDFDRDHSVAREYLASGMRTSWAIDQGVRIYKEATLQLIARPNNEFIVRAELIGTIEPDGSYTRAPAGTHLESSVRLGQLGGEWRIVGLDPGLLLTEGDVARAYREVDLYFFDAATNSRLVPDPVVLPIKQGIATSVVQALLKGPTTRLRGAAVSQFPAGTRLDARTVPVENGVVDVNLSGEARRAVGRQRELLSAQLGWTLRALPDIRAVQIMVNDTNYTVPGVPEQQPRDAWQEYAPDVLGPATPLYAVANKRLGVLSSPDGPRPGTLVPLGGPAGSGHLPLLDPAISIGGESVAGLSANRRTLYRGSFADNAQFVRALDGNDLSEPSWDVGGGLWTVDRTPRGPVVHLLTGTVDVRVEATELGAERVRSFRVARDGARVAAVVDDGGGHTRLVVGRVERTGPAPRLAGFRPIGGELVKVIQVVWQDADHVVVLARKDDGSPAQPYIVDIDGGPAEATAPLVGITSIAAAPGDRLFAVAAKGRVWQFEGEGWQRTGGATELSFQG